MPDPLTTNNERITVLNAALAQYGILSGRNDWVDDLPWDDLPRYLLIEQEVAREGRLYPSVHFNLDAAGAYHVNQESAEQWEIMVAVDLATGDTYSALTTIEFVRDAQEE